MVIHTEQVLCFEKCETGSGMGGGVLETRFLKVQLTLTWAPWFYNGMLSCRRRVKMLSVWTAPSLWETLSLDICISHKYWADVSRTSSACELVSGESPSRRTGTGVEPGTARWQETDVSAGARTGVTGVITCRKKHIKTLKSTWNQYCPVFLL